MVWGFLNSSKSNLNKNVLYPSHALESEVAHIARERRIIKSIGIKNLVTFSIPFFIPDETIMAVRTRLNRCPNKTLLPLLIEPKKVSASLKFFGNPKNNEWNKVLRSTPL